MKITYDIYSIDNITVCSPSEDYHRRPYDWNEDSISTINFIQGAFNTIEECYEYMKDNNYKGNFKILTNIEI